MTECNIIKCNKEAELIGRLAHIKIHYCHKHKGHWDKISQYLHRTQRYEAKNYSRISPEGVTNNAER